MGKIFSLIKNGRRVDIEQTEFLKMVNAAGAELTKGGPGSGRYPKGSGEDKPTGESSTSNYKLTSSETKYAKELSESAAEIAYEHGDALKHSGSDEVVRDWFVAGESKIDYDDLKNMTSKVAAFKEENPKASYEDAIKFATEEYRKEAGDRVEENKAKEIDYNAKWTAERAKVVEANTPSKDEHFRQRGGKADFEENRYTADGPTGGGAYTDLHFHTAKDAKEAANYVNESIKTKSGAHQSTEAEVGSKANDAKYYTVHIRHGGGDSENRDKETKTLQSVVDKIGRRFGKK